MIAVKLTFLHLLKISHYTLFTFITLDLFLIFIPLISSFFYTLVSEWERFSGKAGNLSLRVDIKGEPDS